MQAKRVVPLVVVGLAAAVAARCSGDGGEADPDPLPRCEVDLAPYVKTGSGAVAKVATQSDLFGGDAASGRPGDVLIANDRIRVVIEAPGRTIGPQPYGGNIIDADLVGTAGNDQFGELGMLVQLGRTVDVRKLEILQDGAAGGPAIVAATGRDEELDFINLPGLLKQYVPIDLPDPNQDLNLRVTTYYVLNPGSPAVHVVQALCHEGPEAIAIPAGDLIDSGGKTEVFGGKLGFGSTGASGGPESLLGSLGDNDGHPFFGYVGDGIAYGYVPEANLIQVLTISGVTGTLFNTRSISAWTAGEGAPPPPGAVILEPGAKTTVVRDFVVTRDAGELYDYYYAKNKIATGRISGRVVRPDGSVVAGARVSAKSGTDVVSLFTTNAEGWFGGDVPIGTIEVMADDGVTRSSAALMPSVAGGSGTSRDLELGARGSIAVHVRDATGAAMPGKVTVTCPGDCAVPRRGAVANRFFDSQLDGLPKTDVGETFAIEYLGPAGDTTLGVPPGEYDVWVSRGPEWSLAKTRVTVAAGETKTVESKLAHVVDTTGWVSGDLHVHAINSPDSPIPNVQRLESFMAEGVDVLVATDHDYISDLAPFLAQIPNGAKHLKTIIGVELTTFDYGHYNGFPLVVDASKRNGGAPDWAGGTELGFAPDRIFTSLQDFPGEQVVQLNHAGSGFFSAVGVDTRTFWSRGDAALHRIGGAVPNAATGDTGLFSDKFTALEIQNGFGESGAIKLMNSWFALMSRGVVRTGTAVSDTHKRHGDAGHPRTWVKSSTDAAEQIVPAAFAKALNEHRAFGSNGPFVVLKAKSGASTAEPGDTLVANGPVTVEIEVRTPDWMNVTGVDLFVNATGTATDDKGRIPDVLPTPRASLVLEPQTVEVNGGTAKVARVTTELTLDGDAWIVALVKGDSDLFPVVGKGGVKPRAFTNPVLVDVGGNGWTPPVDLAAERARVGSLKPGGQPLRAKPTEAEIREILAHGQCDHGH